MAETTRTIVIAGRQFTLRASQVRRGVRNVLPEPIRDHFVVIDHRRYPPKQVVGLVTGLDRAEFTTHHARRILAGLGFPAGRRTGQGKTDGTGSATAREQARSARRVRGKTVRPSAETLEPFVGEWVATKGPDVLVSAHDPRTVVGWLAEHRQQADSMFRVPRNEFEASGAAPR